MLVRLNEVLAGVRSALDAPVAIERDLDRLLIPPPADPARGRHPGDYPESALTAARFTVRLLARVPGGRWRNTCLYRSVAECLTLRKLGVPARVCLGVEKEEALRSIAAHAWIEILGAGGATGPPPRGMTRLTGAREGPLEPRD